MSYQVLARKWRPATFGQLVGQDHVKSALTNGLSHQRLHHAYLFTGTRGVGKTTIARIFAKSLNCEQGVTAEPCGQCSVCVDVDAGRFVDLIEIDAASRTKVGDTREILDNVQYAPTRGRYKIYLIDEVHMLSRHSFNALLKTLEEPPEHVKFLLATTDPQKLPITILSRCLQFNLQALTQQQISSQLTSILTSENIPFEAAGIELLARFAKGSMRDALSLTDQAIATSGNNITVNSVQGMLGTVDIRWSQNILKAILANNADNLMDELSRLQQQYPDIEKVIDDMLTLCHQVALAQVVSSAAKLAAENQQFVSEVAQQVSAAEIQVYYQLLIQGKRDLHFASDLYSGLEMTCLRMLAFKPVAAEQLEKKNTTSYVEPTAPVNQETAVEQDLKIQSQPLPENQPQHNSAPVEAASSETNAFTSVEPDSDSSIDDAELEALNAQQQLIQQQAESLHQAEPLHQAEGSQHPSTQAIDSQSNELFQPPQVASDYQETQIEPQQEHQPALVEQEPMNADVPQQQPESVIHDSPVMAILAARGIEPGTTTIASADSAFVEKTVTEVEPEQPKIEIPQPENLKPVENEEVKFAHEVDRWAAIIESSELAGRSRQLALNGSVIENDNHIEFTVHQEFAHLLTEKTEAELIEVVNHIQPDAHFEIKHVDQVATSPRAIQKNINENRQQRAEDSIHQDPLVTTLINEFDATIVTDSIRPLD